MPVPGAWVTIEASPLTFSPAKLRVPVTSAAVSIARSRLLLR